MRLSRRSARQQRKEATTLTADEQMKVSLYRHDPVLFVQKELGESPSKDQQKLLRAVANLDKKRIIICAGRGAGKTKAVSWIVEWNAAVLVDYFDKYETYVLGGSLEQSKRMYSYFRNDVYRTPLLSKRLTDEPTMRETRFVKGKVQALAASSKQVRGPHVECLIIDEVCEADEEIILDALPMPLGSLHGRLIMLSTPHRFFGIFQDFWEEHKEYHYTRFGPWSLYDCPWIEPFDIELLKKKFTPERYTYEVLGRFPVFGRLLFSRKWIKNCTASEPFGLNKNFDMNLGVDWGDVEAKTGVVPVQLYDGKIHVPGPDIFYEDIDYPRIIGEISDLYQRHRGTAAFCDAAERGGNDFLEKTGADVERVYFSKDKQKMQVNLQTLLYHGELSISPNCVQLIEELRKYRRREKRKPKPKGQDMVDALMLAVFQFADEDLLRESSIADRFLAF